MSERSPDFDVTAVNKSGRKVRIGTAWNETGNTSGNPYISMQIDVGLGPFRVNAVQTQEARKAKSEDFEIIPLVSNGTMKSGSISGELTAMDADNAFAGYIANMMFDLDFMLIENDFKPRKPIPTTGSRSARRRAKRSASVPLGWRKAPAPAMNTSRC